MYKNEPSVYVNSLLHNQSLGLYSENTQDKELWRLSIMRITGYLANGCQDSVCG